MQRRDFVKLMGATICCGNITATAAEPKNKGEPAVLFLFLNGGASHIETFNPIPYAPADRRSVTGAIKTKVPGMELGALFPNLADLADRISVVRSFGHRDQNHASSVHWVVTGEANFGAGTSSKWPSMGSCVTKYHGTNTPTGLPTYVKIGQTEHDDAAWLGGKYMGFDATREGRRDLKLLGTSDKFKQRLQILDVIDNKFTGQKQQLAKDWKDLKEQAVNVILGDASKAFQVESDKDYNSYKEDSFGTDCLTAVRLLEAGSKFVSLTLGGWDMHQNIMAGLQNQQTKLDFYLAKLMNTLAQRDLYDRVLLVVTSEFGRTPKVNANQGRDHFGKIAPLMLSCGSYDMGRVIGATNANADDVEEGRCEPQDLTWTIFDHMKMDKKTRWTATDGRPHYVAKEEAKNILKDIT